MHLRTRDLARARDWALAPDVQLLDEPGVLLDEAEAKLGILAHQVPMISAVGHQ